MSSVSRATFAGIPYGLSANGKQFENDRGESEGMISPFTGEELQVKFLWDSEENSLKY
jgi:hypothetical protein